MDDAHSPKRIAALARLLVVFLTHVPIGRNWPTLRLSAGVPWHGFRTSEAQLALEELPARLRDGVWVRPDLPEMALGDMRRPGASSMYGKPRRSHLDSLHVACALELRAERFWTFDDRQAGWLRRSGWIRKPDSRCRKAHCGVIIPPRRVAAGQHDAAMIDHLREAELREFSSGRLSRSINAPPQAGHQSRPGSRQPARRGNGCRCVPYQNNNAFHCLW